jgi:hypothetical protein
LSLFISTSIRFRQKDHCVETFYKEFIEKQVLNASFVSERLNADRCSLKVIMVAENAAHLICVFLSDHVKESYSECLTGSPALNFTLAVLDLFRIPPKFQFSWAIIFLLQDYYYYYFW